MTAEVSCERRPLVRPEYADADRRLHRMFYSSAFPLPRLVKGLTRATPASARG